MSMSPTITTGGLIVVRLSERRADEDDARLSRATESWPIRFLADSTMFIDSRPGRSLFALLARPRLKLDFDTVAEHASVLFDRGQAR